MGTIHEDVDGVLGERGTAGAEEGVDTGIRAIEGSALGVGVFVEPEADIRYRSFALETEHFEVAHGVGFDGLEGVLSGLEFVGDGIDATEAPPIDVAPGAHFVEEDIEACGNGATGFEGDETGEVLSKVEDLGRCFRGPGARRPG